MSRFIILLGLLVTMTAVYGGDMDHYCGENESWHPCGKYCEPKCKTPEGCTLGTILCNSSTAGCRCNLAYLRDTSDGPCVLLADCPTD